MKYVVMTGDFMKMTPTDINRFPEATMEGIGELAADMMRENIGDKHVYKGELKDSITWRTAHATGENKAHSPEDVIAAPTGPGVDVGSANEHAEYVELGTGPHVSATDSDEFVAEMMEWGKSKFRFSEDIIWAIINEIRNEGTMHELGGKYIGGLHYAEKVAQKGEAIVRAVSKASSTQVYGKKR